MDRSVEVEIDVLAGSRSWSATPDNYSSLRSVRLRRDGTGTIIYGYGQTIYAQIDCRFEVPRAGRIRFEYLDTPQPQRRPPFLWTLEFTEPPYPDGLSFPYTVPKVFYGYGERIGDRNTPLP